MLGIIGHHKKYRSLYKYSHRHGGLTPIKACWFAARGRTSSAIPRDRAQSPVSQAVRAARSTRRRARASDRYRPPIGGYAARSPDGGLARRTPALTSAGMTARPGPPSSRATRWTDSSPPLRFRSACSTPPVRRISRLAMRARRTNRVVATRPDDPHFSELPREPDLDTARRRSRRARLPEAEEWSRRVASPRRALCRGQPETPPRPVGPRRIAAGGRTAAAQRPIRSGSRSSRLYNGRWRAGWADGRRSARDRGCADFPAALGRKPSRRRLVAPRSGSIACRRPVVRASSDPRSRSERRAPRNRGGASKRPARLSQSSPPRPWYATNEFRLGCRPLRSRIRLGTIAQRQRRCARSPPRRDARPPRYQDVAAANLPAHRSEFAAAGSEWGRAPPVPWRGPQGIAPTAPRSHDGSRRFALRAAPPEPGMSPTAAWRAQRPIRR